MTDLDELLDEAKAAIEEVNARRESERRGARATAQAIALTTLKDRFERLLRDDLGGRVAAAIQPAYIGGADTIDPEEGVCVQFRFGRRWQRLHPRRSPGAACWDIQYAPDRDGRPEGLLWVRRDWVLREEVFSTDLVRYLVQDREEQREQEERRAQQQREYDEHKAEQERRDAQRKAQAEAERARRRARSDELQAKVDAFQAELAKAVWPWPEGKVLVLWKWRWAGPSSSVDPEGHVVAYPEEGWSLQPDLWPSGRLYLLARTGTRVLRLLSEAHRPIAERHLFRDVEALPEELREEIGGVLPDVGWRHWSGEDATLIDDPGGEYRVRAGFQPIAPLREERWYRDEGEVA